MAASGGKRKNARRKYGVRATRGKQRLRASAKNSRVA